MEKLENKTKIVVKKGDITKEKVDAIVNPANSFGMMGGGVAYAIKKAGGEEIEREAMEKSPIPVGEAISTTAGRLNSRIVIHSPTMKNPAERIGIENVEKATLAALRLASKLNIKSLAFPGMGTGVGGIRKRDAARAMIKTIKSFLRKDTTLREIILVGFDDELTQEFKNALEE